MDVSLNLTLDQVGLIFSNEEFKLMNNENVYFSKRHLLGTIYKQLDDHGKNVIENKYPETVSLLMKTGMLY